MANEKRDKLASVHSPVRAVIAPLQEFISTETLGALLLFAAAGAALFWANAPYGESYADFWGKELRLNLGLIDLDESLVKWVNDALMALFFFVVGLEIKRELIEGELAGVRKAALPVAAALGGMALPALLYTSINAGGDGARGWGMPMATDIAFAVGVLSLVGRRVPLALKVFLLSLAIADDIGAIAVIAIFYTTDLSPGWLAVAAVIFVAIAALPSLRMRSTVVYALLGVAGWLAVFESGVHATIAGVVLGLLMPTSAESGASLVDRFEHALHPWTSLLVVPLFALANAGIALDGDAVADAIASPISVGVALSLIVGKPAGIVAFAWLAVRSGVAALPQGVGWAQLASAGTVAGIGFTVSLFIANLAFNDAQLIAEAKLGILAASTVMGLLGYLALRVTCPTEGAAARDEPRD